MDYMPRTRWLLKVFGLSPPEGEDRTYEIRQWLNFSLPFYYILGVMFYSVTSLGDPRIPVAEKIELLAILSTISTFMYNYVCTYYLRYELVRIFEKVENVDTFGEPPNLKRRCKLIDYLSVGVLVYSGLGAAALDLAPVFQIANCKRRKEVEDAGVMCGFLVGLTYPYDISTDFIYYVHLAIELYSTITLSTKGVIYFGFCMGLFEAIIVRFQHLISKLGQVYADDNCDVQKARLRYCIAYHIYILDLTECVNETVALLTIPCLLCYNFIIGMSVMGIMTDGSMLSILLTCGWISALFAGCATGERVINASVAVAEAAYDMKWYTDARLRRDIMLIILRSQRVVAIKCGSLGVLSFVTFKKIMQGAYTYATMRSGLEQ